jgi:hypothetical protein
VLIDHNHKRWVLWTVALSTAGVLLYVWLDLSTPGGLTAGGTVGLWYGMAGGACLVFVGLLSQLRKVPRWQWLPPRKVWLRGHLWLSLLGTVLLLCHGRFHWGGLLEVVLWVVLLMTLATGVLGLLLQQFVPRLITTQVPCEAPYEQIPHICRVMRRRGDEVVLGGREPSAAPAALQEFYLHHVRPFLAVPARASFLSNSFQAEAAFDRLRALEEMGDSREQLALVETLCTERRYLLNQERLHLWLHAWLLVHVPLAAALLVLGLAPAVTALYY